MSRITLAFGSFFRLLFGAKLHPAAAAYLPQSSANPALPAAGQKPPTPEPATAPAPAAKMPESRKPSPADRETLHTEGALAMLGLLQREGRLLDFLSESLDDYDDGDIGAAVRDIHRGCKSVIDSHLTVEPVMPGDEEDNVTVAKGFDPSEIRLIGEVKGAPPFKGTLRHAGIRVTEVRLPKLSDGVDRRILAPAEVEVS